jgi:DNA-binding response OmpR family regulator
MKYLILLVEDNPDDAFFFKRAVENSGWDAEVHHTATAREAVAYLEQIGKQRSGVLPGLAFMDELLADGRGNHLLKWIKDDKKCCDIPVVVLSGGLTDRLTSELRESGANAVMLKSPRLEDLDAGIKAACAFWLGHCIPPEWREKPGAGGSVVLDGRSS